MTARLNPVAKLAASVVIAVALLLSLDWVSASVALVLEIVLLPFAGVAPRRLLQRTLPLVAAALLTGLLIVLYGRPSGVTYLHWVFVDISAGSVALATATTLRVLAVALPAVVLFITVDPTDLADGLGQVLHLPSRFVLGALGALRLSGLFLEDWRSLELARRARGIADRGRVRRFVGQAFALLVLSLRRGSKLATAMEARGFGASNHRSWARPSTFRWPEWLLIIVATALSLAAVGAAIASGQWNFLASR
jgi:energy-coupling factor transport system permease protein